MVSRWDRWPQQDGANWLEVYGESDPVSVPLAGLFSTDSNASREFTPYLYVWTFGYTGDTPDKAEVRLLFPAVDGWRVKDVQALVYHLPPVQEEREWRTAVAEDLNALAPAVGLAGQLAAEVAPLPGLSAASAAIAHLKMRSAPQVGHDAWYVRRIHQHTGGTLYYGVEWTLPGKLLQQVGTRVTGALLVQYFSAEPVRGGGRRDGALLSHARLTVKGRAVELPAGSWSEDPVTDAFVMLPLSVTAQAARE
ncbi:hypothetical protein ACWCQ1_27490 [Streptomyces sp. NPDC002144]|uniref:hypothetical protein n=1 Tax=Streptomyces sp. NPDC006668 TaxID=3156903 RepID=UPI003406D74D